MKKFIILLFVGAFAKVSFAQSFSLGAKAGVNLSSLTTDMSGVSQGDQQIGFTGGVFSRIGILGFFVEPSVMYSQRKGSFQASGQTSTTRLDYIDVPVMVGYSFLSVARAYLGPNFQFLVNADQSGAKSSNFSKDNFESTGVGLQVGVGVDISRLTIDLRYDGCITNLGKKVVDQNTNQKVDYSTRANMFQLTVGYKFIKL
jgi:hypothetical protein